MKLTLNHTAIPTDFLTFLQSVLPKEMQELPIHIVIQETWIQTRELIACFPPSYWESVKKGEISGSFATDRSGELENYILLYPENFSGNVTWFTAFNFFHECRHAYQRHFIPINIG